MAILFYIFGRVVCATGLCIVLVSLIACSSFATRTRHAASAAARDPWTWAPIAGAAVIAGTNSDQRISDWAKTKTPLFGSQASATDASDRFRLYASNSAWVTLLVSPVTAEKNWFTEKGGDATGGMVGLALARSTTGLLKHTAQRERPNGNPVHDSFPSAHSTDAFAHASLTRNYTDDLSTASPMRMGMQWASDGFAVATAWGRVEGGAHYPTDVLIGAALANFTTRFFMKMAESNTKIDWRMHTRTNEYGDVIVVIETPF